MGPERGTPRGFRAQAASLVVDDGRGVRGVAGELGIHHEAECDSVTQGCVVTVPPALLG
jgi:hypothetical protein